MVFIFREGHDFIKIINYLNLISKLGKGLLATL